jgi:hypothetical protein
MKFGQRDLALRKRGSPRAYKTKRLQVAVAGSRLLVCPAVFGQTVKVNSNAKAQFWKYKTSSSKASTTPRNRLGILTVDGACGTPPPENGLGPTGE